MKKFGRIVSLISSLLEMQISTITKNITESFKDYVKKPIVQRYKAYLKRPSQLFYRNNIRDPYRNYILPVAQSIAKPLKSIGQKLYPVAKWTAIIAFSPILLPVLGIKFAYPYVKAVAKSIYSPVDRRLDISIDTLENNEKSKIMELMPELKKKLREELKKEWKSNVERLERQETKMGERRQQVPMQVAEMDEFLEKHGSGLSDAVIVELKAVREERLSDILELRRRIEAAKHKAPVPELNDDNFDHHLSYALGFNFEQNISTHTGGVSGVKGNRLIVTIDSAFVEACEKAHFQTLRDKIQTAACKFMDENGYSPKKYKPQISTSVINTSQPAALHA